MKENIFDIENTDDLPKELIKSVKHAKNTFKPETLALLKLFNLKSPLTANEILVGMFRAEKIIKQKNWVHSTTENLVRKKLLKKVARSTWSKIENA